jgi:hypothetical protein
MNISTKPKAIGVAFGIFSLGLLGCHSAKDSGGLAGEAAAPEAVGRRDARRLMQRFESGDFFVPAPDETVKQSGWEMTNEKGATFIRSTLDRQASRLVPIGREAVPELVRWLEHREMQIRYIAHKALEEITSQKPWFPHFTTLEELRAKGWLEESRKIWMSWYAH